MNTELKPCDGGVCAAKGFRAAGIHAGLRKNKDKLDLALIVAEKDCAAAGAFTQNRVFAAPVGVTRAHISNGVARAAICNSGKRQRLHAGRIRERGEDLRGARR